MDSQKHSASTVEICFHIASNGRRDSSANLDPYARRAWHLHKDYRPQNALSSGTAGDIFLGCKLS